MQTFLPLPNFYQSLWTLDPKRLGNQIYLEAKIIVNGGWPNHPISKMWKGYEWQLCTYCLEGLRVLANKHNRNYPHWEDYFFELQKTFTNKSLPPWIGFKPLHLSHQSNLVRKNPNHYKQFIPNLFSVKSLIELPYIWYDPVLKKYYNKDSKMKKRIYIK